MIVYVASRYYYDQWDILGVFTSEELAHACNKADGEAYPDPDGRPYYGYDVDPFELDKIK